MTVRGSHTGRITVMKVILTVTTVRSCIKIDVWKMVSRILFYKTVFITVGAVDVIVNDS